MKDVKIEQQTCIGCEMCESTCLEVFVLNAQAESTVVEKYRTKGKDEGEVTNEIDCVEDAEDSRPEDVISVS